MPIIILDSSKSCFSPSWKAMEQPFHSRHLRVMSSPRCCHLMHYYMDKAFSFSYLSRRKKAGCFVAFGQMMQISVQSNTDPEFCLSLLSVLSERAAQAMGPEKESWRTCMKTSPPPECPFNRALSQSSLRPFARTTVHSPSCWLAVLCTEWTPRFKSDTLLMSTFTIQAC